MRRIWKLSPEQKADPPNGSARQASNGPTHATGGVGQFLPSGPSSLSRCAVSMTAEYEARTAVERVPVLRLASL
jgi:hypothetical protein